MRVALMTITEFAESVGTSVATVTRFARALGFQRYGDFRSALGLESGGKGDGFTDTHTRGSPSDGNPKLQTFIERLMKAKHVYLVGLGTGSSFADVFYELLLARRPGVFRISTGRLADVSGADFFVDNSQCFVVVIATGNGSDNENVVLPTRRTCTGAILSILSGTARSADWDIVLSPEMVGLPGHTDISLLLLIHGILHQYDEKKLALDYVGGSVDRDRQERNHLRT